MFSQNIHIVERVKEYSEKIAPKFGVEIFDVKFVREPSGYTLRVFLDKENLTLEDCANFSKEISKWLDKEDLIPHKYNLEVSSPGLNRPLRNIDDYKKYIGRKCKIELFKKDPSGRKNYTGYIKGVDGEVILLDVKKEEIIVNYSDIKKGNLEFEIKE
ncbi:MULTISPECIES: ribosome maturation factor RimP [Calditerrivibrio]|uniref:ribosome maturation factor RimP n=1 Tax=Calditerrivibrio TaxID=545865 RepID=UPI003C732D66